MMRSSIGFAPVADELKEKRKSRWKQNVRFPNEAAIWAVGSSVLLSHGMRIDPQGKRWAS